MVGGLASGAIDCELEMRSGQEKMVSSLSIQLKK